MNPNNTEKATLGGGCFWCLEPIFADLIGVGSVVPGYAGGSDPNPSYKAVCSGTTGHAEVVQKGTTIKRVPSDHDEIERFRADIIAFFEEMFKDVLQVRTIEGKREQR